MAATARLSEQLPWRTLCLCGLVLCAQAFPALHELLSFDRNAIQQGQLWRLLSGNLTHHSPTHLTLNLFAMLVVGSLLEARRYRGYGLLVLGSAATIGTTVYLLRTDIVHYAGLSGIVTAALVMLCLLGLQEERIWRGICATMLVAITLKLGAELWFGLSLEQQLDQTLFQPVAESHLAGALTGLGIFLTHTRNIPRSPKIQLTD